MLQRFAAKTPTLGYLPSLCLLPGHLQLQWQATPAAAEQERNLPYFSIFLNFPVSRVQFCSTVGTSANKK